MRNRSMWCLVLLTLICSVVSTPLALAKGANGTILRASELHGPAKGRTFYIVAAHPDDDMVAWSYLEQLPKDTYMVFISMTRGNGTESCLKPEDAYNRPGSDALAPTELETFARRVVGVPAATDEDSTGPYKYEGPDSPVDEPDKGERHPLGYPWVGQGTEVYADAVVASHHWFQDDQFHNDGIGTDFAIENDPELDDDHKGTFCPPGHQGQGAGRPIEKQIGCARVWADERGARIIFDLDNSFYDDGFLPPGFTSEEVTAALQAVRSHRSQWGMPLLPEEGVLATTLYADGESCPTNPNWNPEHGVVNEAIRYTDQDLPLRAGVMACSEDKLGEEATVRGLVQAPSSVVMYSLLNPVNGYRLGAAVVNYGWLFPDYGFGGCLYCDYWEIRS